MRNRIYYIITVFFLLFWNSGSVKGQYVNFRLELPAGIKYVSPVVLTNLENHGEEIVWIEMASQENITFLLSYRFEQSINANPKTIYFLNDGSTDLIQAKKYTGSNFYLRMFDNSLIRRDLGSVPNALLGLPNTKNITYYIEYN